MNNEIRIIFKYPLNVNTEMNKYFKIKNRMKNIKPINTLHIPCSLVAEI